jgi:hypothetical protein
MIRESGTAEPTMFRFITYPAARVELGLISVARKAGILRCMNR